MIRMKKIAFIGLVITLITSCNKKRDFTPVCDGTSPTYDSFVSLLVASNCSTSGCHGSGSSNGDFTSYTGLSSVTTNGKFEQEVLTNQSMPQGSSTLSESDLNKLKCWVENGFPEN